MKVLLIHKFFKLTGGADLFFFEVGRVLEDNGHEVAYFSTSDKDNLPSPWSKYFCEAPNFKQKNIVGQVKAFSQIPYNFQSKKKFETLLDDFKPDLIHCFNIITHISPSILTSAKQRNIPVVISLNDYKHICPNYKLFHHGQVCEDCKGGKFHNAVLNKCSHDSIVFSVASALESYVHNWLNVYRNNIDLFLFASDFMAQKTESFWGKTFKWGKLLNPFNIPLLPKESLRGEYGLYFGRLIDEKGVDVLINALKKCPNIPFKIVGDGPDLENLVKLVRKFGLENVEFLGPMWGDALNDILLNAQFVVVPSIWHENFPYVILQAFAFCKPVIGSNRGGIPEMVDDGNRGLLYEATCPNDLAERINYLFNNEKLYEMGLNARSYIEENFTDKVFYAEIMNNYKNILK